MRVGKRTAGPANAVHVAVRRNGYPGVGQCHGLVDFGHVGDAHRAPRPHDDIEPFGHERAQTKLGDRLFVTAANVHDR